MRHVASVYQGAKETPERYPFGGLEKIFIAVGKIILLLVRYYKKTLSITINRNPIKTQTK
jgi:hypothetical protein